MFTAYPLIVLMTSNIIYGMTRTRVKCFLHLLFNTVIYKWILLPRVRLDIAVSNISSVFKDYNLIIDYNDSYFIKVALLMLVVINF